MAKRQDSRRVRHIVLSVWHVLLLALIAMAGGMLLAPSSARAAPHTGNYQLAVQVTNGPFSYGGSTLPDFQATLTALNGTTLSSCTPTGSFFVTISVDTDSGTQWGSNSNSASGANTCVYTFVSEPASWSNYAVGLRTVTAQATISGQVVATATATFTVNKTVTTTSCGINGVGPVVQVGSTLQISLQVQGPTTGYTPDWTQSTYEFTFTGPQSVTYSDVAPAGSGLSVMAPSTPGNYSMTCTFNGYGNYAPSTSSSGAVEFSAFHQLAGIQLYTNPTTYNPYQSCDVYVVFLAAPGGPTPTGGASFTIGPNYTKLVTIASNGTLYVRLDPLQLPGEAETQITVDYDGDSYYRWTSANFSFTNPPIPGNTPTSGSSGGSSGKTGTPQAKSQATTTATAPGGTSGTPTLLAGGQNAGAVSSGSSGGSLLLWIGLVVVILVLVGCGLAVFLRARLANPEPSMPFQAPYHTGWPQNSSGWPQDPRGGPDYLDEPPLWTPPSR
jgi:hypothetical protein